MKIDRKELVTRHNPVLDHFDPFSPLSIGNGEIVFTADITGFQTFSNESENAVPLCTMAQQGFHSYPGMEDRQPGYSKLKLKNYTCGSRQVGYMSEPEGQEELFNGLRINPHRANLFRLSLFQNVEEADDGAAQETFSELDLSSCSGFFQKLDLWEGLLSGRMFLCGREIVSEACCHPARDILSYRIKSEMLTEGRLALKLAFPYPSHKIDGSDWQNAAAHTSRLKKAGNPGVYVIERLIDAFRYKLLVHIAGRGTFSQLDEHSFLISTDDDNLEFSLELITPGNTPASEKSISHKDCRAAAAVFWKRFWSDGAVVELKDSRDPRALELERRIILSRYLTAIQCSGSLPPQETGLTCNSWYGKFHLEMHFWHAGFFPLWGNPEMLENSLRYYRSIAAKAEERAAAQGYKGLRWPKMTDPDGYDSPSEIGPFLCWQQPHFIIMAEILYRTGTNGGLIEEYGDLVFKSAEFMADYPLYNSETDTFSLGPPLIPAQENHRPEETLNPVFELEYWKLGLDIAVEWQILTGREVPEKWSLVRDKLAVPPINDVLKVYKAHENCDDTYGRYASDHPSFLIAFSFFSGRDVDPTVMARSLDLVLEDWDINSLWGWDFPVMAMCAARLGRTEEAMDLLLMQADKNTYTPNGHNAQRPKTDLPLYLPGNGALLLAVAMIAGSDPDFSENENWVFHSEGFKPFPF